MRHLIIATSLLLLGCSPGAGTKPQPEDEVHPLVGKSAPEIAAKDWINAGGKDVSLAALRGKPVVVEFWATWCPPCRESIPHLNRLHAELGKKVTIIGLTDEPLSKVTDFVNDMSMSYIVGTRSPSDSKYTMDGIPTAFLVDAQGIVIWAGHPMDPAFEAALRKTVGG